MTERAHAVALVVKALSAIRNLPAMLKAPPFGGAGAPSGVTERVKAPSQRELAKPSGFD